MEQKQRLETKRDLASQKVHQSPAEFQKQEAIHTKPDLSQKFKDMIEQMRKEIQDNAEHFQK